LTVVNFGSEAAIMLTTVLIVILVLALIGALPTWGHSRNWGYGPGGGVGLLLIILLVLVFSGRL
jgi:hypothetical protein